ncbi:MAG: hypothetical protein ICV59_02745 [Thermoleophilia bacterium]|nr:hypothetical protein [Thermoleophilia bacterium]
MPRITAPPQSLLIRLAVLALAGVVMSLDRRAARRSPAPPPPLAPTRVRRPLRRLAVTLALVTLFSLGAALSALGGDQAATLLEDEPAVETATAPPAEPPAATSEPEPAGQPDPAEMDGPDAAHGAPPSSADAPAAGTEPPPEDHVVSRPARLDDDEIARTAVAPGLRAAQATPAAPPRRPSRRAAGEPVFRIPPALTAGAAVDAEATLPGVDATVWLHRTLPDPTPASRRLTPSFARGLTAASRRADVDWALVLGVLRARGGLGSAPASPAQLDQLARALARHGARASGWGAVVALEGDTAAADTALALAHYHRAVGLAALVRGLESAKVRLGARLLKDPRVHVYEGGRADIAAGRIDVRVLVLIAYLAEAHGGVTVSSLQSGHRLYSRPGVVSAHVFGLAVDVSALGGVPVLGNQSPGGLAERAVRSILLLPAELRPRQVISLLGLGGPSFPMSDHGDHIHVGY